MAAADIAIAARDAVFAFSEVKLGIVPGGDLAVRAREDRRRARRGRYFLTGERFDAETALRIGLVHEVADDLDAAVDRVVDELLSAGPHAVRWAKRLVRERPDGPETARWIAERRTSAEGQEGLAAFAGEAPAELENSRIMSLRSRFFALTYDRQLAKVEKEGLGDLRKESLAAASGRVLEIGAGTGANLPLYGPASSR